MIILKPHPYTILGFFYHQRKYRFLDQDVGKQNVLIIFFFKFHENIYEDHYTRIILRNRYYEMNTIKKLMA
jgi:hypothetical protein